MCGRWEARTLVGAVVGDWVGGTVGDKDGATVGRTVGLWLGLTVGGTVGGFPYRRAVRATKGGGIRHRGRPADARSPSS